MRVSLPRALLLASVVVAGATVALGLVMRPGPKAARTTPPATAPTTVPTTTTAPAPAPAAFSIVAPTVRPAAYGATLTWSTPDSATGSFQWGPTGMEPLLWSNVQSSSPTQRVELSVLAAATRYPATIEAL